MDAKAAEYYNQVRRILFCAVHNPSQGFSTAYEWMEKTYRRKLGAQSATGLMAELKFYERYRKDFKLTVAGDVGDHADFCGLFGSRATRFDATTNLDYKKFKTYEPFLGGELD